jgi:hypothetical protein
MLVGVTLFGYAISNISCSIMNSVKDEQQYLNSISFFNKLCFENNIDYNIHQMVMSDLEN